MATPAIGDVVVAIPVLGRPDRAGPLIESLRRSERVARLRPVFVLSPGDAPELAAVEATGADYLVMTEPPGRADYAKKINLAYRSSAERWIFQAADDLCFCHGWADKALTQARKHRKRVVGTNDLGNARVISGRHSTHSLFARSYVDELGTVDGPGAVMAEHYWHNFCDDEAIGTAKARGEWLHARNAHVEHLHPHWGKAEMDATYRLGLSRFNEDTALFESRRRLWASGVVAGAAVQTS